MRRPLIAFASVSFILLGFASLLTAEEKILNVGDPAPTLAVSSFVKGDKVEKFEPGKTYVVEFWATWCGPCRTSIPHLTELAHKYKDQGVQMIGVDVWERDLSLVEPFLKEMGDKMDYAVALDTIPEGKTESEGLMATTWMKAAGERGIPSAFIIRDGKIQWIGHPMAMDEPLAKVVDGTWDYSEFGKTRLERKTVEKKLNAVRDNLAALQRAKDYKGLVKAIEEAAAGDEKLGTELEGMKFMALCNGADVEKGLAMAEKLKAANWNSAGALHRDASNLIDPTTPDKEIDARVAKIALEFATRANELTKERQFQILDTLAEAQFRTGDIAGAIASEEKAIKAFQDMVKEDSPAAKSFLKRYEDRLERFRKALPEKKDAA